MAERGAMRAGLTARHSRIAWVWLVPIATVGGGIAAVNPPLAGAFGAAAVGLALLALGRGTSKVFFAFLTVLLIGYAFAGRGFAYVGLAPIYVGEAALLLGLAALVTNVPSWRPSAVQALILSFMAWGLMRTLPYVGTYGSESLRDGVVWGYATFAVVIPLLATPAHVLGMVRWYGRLAPAFIVWVPVLAVTWHVASEALPLVPGSEVQIPYFKPGDLAVHLAGAAAFLLAGIAVHRGGRALIQPLLWAVWLGGFVMISALNRAGMLAMTTAAATLLFVRTPGRWAALILVGLLLLGVAGLFNMRVELDGRREISVSQVIENVQSIVGESEDPALAGTRRWREDWWDAIINYTLRGPNFWLGKGFGINLAEDDGVQAPDASLRAPHNAHLNILARMGVPGLGLWLSLQTAFAVALIRAARTAARSGQRLWLGIIGWIFVYWLAAIVNMTFDVYLEGPQGGILFWSLIGFGLATASFVQRNHMSQPDGGETGSQRKREPMVIHPLARRGGGS